MRCSGGRPSLCALWAPEEVHDVLRAASPTHRRLRDHLLAIFVATAVVDLGCAALAFLLERNAQQTEIGTIGSAFFWTRRSSSRSHRRLRTRSLGGRILDEHGWRLVKNKSKRPIDGLIALALAFSQADEMLGAGSPVMSIL
jgi:hypothetical protein